LISFLSWQIILLSIKQLWVCEACKGNIHSISVLHKYLYINIGYTTFLRTWEELSQLKCLYKCPSRFNFICSCPARFNNILFSERNSYGYYSHTNALQGSVLFGLCPSRFNFIWIMPFKVQWYLFYALQGPIIYMVYFKTNI